MQIGVTFRHIETDDGVKDYVKGKVKRLQKYIENPREVHVVLSAEKFRHTAEITITGDKNTLNSQGHDSDLYAAIDQMVEKMERQIRERHGKGRRKRSDSLSSKASLQTTGESLVDQEEIENLSIIKKRYNLPKPMSIEEAIEQLRLSKKEFLFFINSDSGRMNGLYRCKDGGYEWVEAVTK
jgi:putative sigma-54 modulation protein